MSDSLQLLNLGETIASEKYTQQINEVHCKLQGLHSALVNSKGPVLLHNNAQPHHRMTNTSEVEWIGLQSFASSAIFTWPLANFATLLLASWQLFSGEILPQPTGCRKCFPRVQWIWNTDFYATGINQVISHYQKCVDCNGSYFEPSYNNLKFRVWKCNYFCNNMIVGERNR